MGHHLLDVADIPLDILQIPAENNPRFSCSMGALLGVCQIAFPSLLAIGAGLLGVQITGGRMLGHYDARFTLRTYTHATRQKQDEAARTMGSIMTQVM